MKKLPSSVAGYILLGLGHIAGVAFVGLCTLLLVLPFRHARGIGSILHDVPVVFEMSTAGILLHVALSACVWAFLCIVAALVKLRSRERTVEQRRVVRLARGSVITETLIVMPVFFLLTFGMAQLAINNIAGILANVAAYQAARAAWVWQPEATAGRLGVNDERATEMCKIAVAFVMLPVAPSEYKQTGNIGTGVAKNARMLALGANVPGGGVLVTSLPDQFGEFVEAVAEYDSGSFLLNNKEAVRANQSYFVALDGTAGFLRRTGRKFTQAYHASSCTIAANGLVSMEYKHQAVMPLVGRIFSDGSVTETGGRRGYFSTYRREFGFRPQHNSINTQLPQNSGDDPPAPEEPSPDLRGEAEGG